MMNLKLKGVAKVSHKTLVRVTAMVLAIAVLCAGTAFAATGERYTVDVYDGSLITRVETSADDAMAVVDEAGIELSANDKLLLDEFTPGADSVIVICRESKVTFIGPDSEAQEIMFAGTVNELIESMGITLGDDFVSSVDIDAVVTDNMEVRILSANGLTINVDGETKTVKSTARTVGELLDEQGIVLDGDDEVSPSEETEIQNGMAVDVLRVEYVTREEQEVIAFETKTVNSAALAKGTTKITTKGVNGEKTVVYKDKVVNGEVQSTTVESEKVITEPVTQVKTVGTLVTTATSASTGLGNKKIEKNGKPISEIALPSKYSIGANNVPTSYKKVITGKAAAYCIPGGTTATGKKVKPGYIAVNPNQIPYGTEMWIVSNDGVVYGYAIAADTGGFAQKNTFVVDLYMSSTSQCYQWGARNVTIYIL